MLYVIVVLKFYFFGFSASKNFIQYRTNDKIYYQAFINNSQDKVDISLFVKFLLYGGGESSISKSYNSKLFHLLEKKVKKNLLIFNILVKNHKWF